MTPNSEESTNKVTKFLQLVKHKWHISHAFRSLSRATKTNGDCESDKEMTFVSANSTELRSIGGTDDGSDDLPSFRLSPLIFPTGILERPPAASPMKIVRRLPFGYVIGRQPDSPAVPSALARSFKKAKPMMASRQLRLRSQMAVNLVSRALKGTFRRGSCRCRLRGAEEADATSDDEEDVFWKKDVLRGLHCRQLEDDDDDAPY